jgi:alginate O-acetyltransferase complex protein AlgJ
MAQNPSIQGSVELHLPVENTSKSHRYKPVIIGLGFIALLLLPTLDQWLALSAGFKSTEKRIPSPFPNFQLPHVQTFIVQFNEYYKENFGWRNALFYQYSQWKYRVLATSPLPEKVVITKNGWFYPGNSMSQVADQHRGLLPIRLETVASVAQHLNNFQRQLAAQGAKLYILVAPDSYTIYPENLPDHFHIRLHTSNFDRFKAYMAQHTTIPVVDVRKALISAKADRTTYYQTDTHWNEYGSLITTLTLVNRIREDFPQIPVPRLSDYHIYTQKGVGGDLVTMLALNREVVDSIAYKIKPAKFLLARNTETIDNIDMGLPSQRFVSASSQLPKLLLVGDSFSFSMNQSLPGYFRESYLVRDHRCDMKLAKTEHPDIVIFEIVERNIGLLAQL